MTPSISASSAAEIFPWPKPHGVSDVRWTGSGFVVDGASRGVLRFGVGESGWTDDLTSLHESSGSGDHPIDVASRRRAIDALASCRRDLGVILEVGCSAGHLLRDLRRSFPRSLVIGTDYVGVPLTSLAAELPDVPLVQCDLTRCPLPDASIDAVVALNVLEHIHDDRRAAREIFRVLRPGGLTVIELPAGPALYDVYDHVLMHHRRYTLRRATRLFEEAGFEVTDRSHLGFLAYPAFAMVKLRNKRLMRLPEAEQRAFVAEAIRKTSKSTVLDLVLRAEARASSFVRYPFGIRCVLTAVKPLDSVP
jgi:SAM-dependent methyltransferase